MARYPVSLLVIDEEFLLDFFDLDEPARDGLVDERRVAPPAERVRVLDDGFLDETTLGLKESTDTLVG